MNGVGLWRMICNVYHTTPSIPLRIVILDIHVTRDILMIVYYPYCACRWHTINDSGYPYNNGIIENMSPLSAVLMICQ